MRLAAAVAACLLALAELPALGAALPAAAGAAGRRGVPAGTGATGIAAETAPLIELSYGDDGPAPGEGGYCASRRVATIEVTCAGFDEGRTQIETTGRVRKGADGSVWEGEGDRRRAAVEFGSGGDQSLRVTCTDTAGRTASRSDSFTIDLIDPRIRVEWEGAQQAGAKDGVAYYASGRTATVYVDEENFERSLIDLEGDGAVEWDVADPRKATVAFSGDGEHRLRVTAADLAGRAAVPYDSGAFVVDSTPPEASVSFEDGEPEQGACYASERVALVSIKDVSFDEGFVMITCSCGEDDSKAVTWSDAGNGEHVGRLILGNSASDHRLSVEASDLAGNKARFADGHGGTRDSYVSSEFSVDTVDPAVEIMRDKEPSGAHGGVDYYNEEMTVSVVAVDDHLDPASSRVSAEGALFESDWERDEQDRSRWVKRLVFGEGAERSIHVVAADRAGRTSGDGPGCSYGPFAIDLTPPEVVGARLTCEPAGAYTSGCLFFDGPAALVVDVADGLGLRSVDVVDTEGGCYDQRVLGASGASAGGTAATATIELVEGRELGCDVRVRAVDLAGNERVWSLSPTGTARVVAEREVENLSPAAPGATRPTALLEDSTAPVVRLDGAEEGAFYNAPRTIALTVDELNIPYLLGEDPDQVVLTVTRREAVAAGTSSSSTRSVQDLFVTGPGALTFVDERGGARAYSRYGFSQELSGDGHYIVEARLSDPAGNVGSARIGEFTIDQTPPSVRVAFDNDDARNGKYYRQARCATITVMEHNFDAALVRIDTNGEVGAWSDDGDAHTLQVRFSADGSYRLSVSGQDKAGNAMEPYQADEFVVDTTPPDVAIAGVGDGCAYAGQASPVIEAADEVGLDAEGVSWELTGANGAQPDLSPAREGDASGQTVRLGDIAHTADLDDVYTLSARAVDLAGNEATATVVFSTNRYGSTFRVLGAEAYGENGGYLARAPEVVVEEVNVSGAEASSCGVLVTHGVEVEELRRTEGPEAAGFCVEEEEAASRAQAWEVRLYRVAAGNFSADGRYRVCVRSRDRAGNLNSSLEYYDREEGRVSSAEVEFVLDTADPVIVDVSVSDGDVIGEAVYAGSFSVVDNVGIREAKAFIDGRETSLVPDGYGIYSFRVEAAAHTLRTLEVVATDLAGRTARAEVAGFRVTTDLIELNPALAAIGLTALLAACAGALWAALRGRARRDGPGKRACGRRAQGRAVG